MVLLHTYANPPAVIIHSLPGEVNLSFAQEQLEFAKLKTSTISIGYTSSEQTTPLFRRTRTKSLISLEKHFDYSRGRLTSWLIREFFLNDFNDLSPQFSSVLCSERFKTPQWHQSNSDSLVITHSDGSDTSVVTPYSDTSSDGVYSVVVRFNSVYSD